MKLRSGRPTKGLEHVDTAQGSPEAKRRVKVILEVTSGALAVKDGAMRLGISTTRLEQLRAQALQGAVSSIEAKPPGRPRTVSSVESAQVSELRRELDWTAWELEASRVREEIALLWPHLVAGRGAPPGVGKARASRDGRPKPDARRGTGGRSVG